MGTGCTASSDRQFVEGSFNTTDSSKIYAHIIGNGSYNNPSNAQTTKWNGDFWTAGDLYTGGTGQDDPNAKKLATEDFVREQIQNIPHWTWEAV